MRASRAGPVLRGQRFANEQILRGPALAALSGPVKGQCRLVCRDSCYLKIRARYVNSKQF